MEKAKWKNDNIGKTFVNKTTGDKAKFVSRADIPSVTLEYGDGRGKGTRIGFCIDSNSDEDWEICEEEKDKCVVAGCDEEEKCPCCNRCQKHHDEKVGRVEEKKTLSDEIYGIDVAPRYSDEKEIVYVFKLKQSLKEFIDWLLWYRSECIKQMVAFDEKRIEKKAKEIFGERLILNGIYRRRKSRL